MKGHSLCCTARKSALRLLSLTSYMKVTCLLPSSYSSDDIFDYIADISRHAATGMTSDLSCCDPVPAAHPNSPRDNLCSSMIIL